LDRPCQIHGSREKPASHTSRNCWVIKQASRALAKEQAKGIRVMTRKIRASRTMAPRSSSLRR
jgi:hypothetical protein